MCFKGFSLLILVTILLWVSPVRVILMRLTFDALLKLWVFLLKETVLLWWLLLRLVFAT
jgi:hypothetical protein